MLPCQTQSETRTPPAINVMNPLLYLQQRKAHRHKAGCDASCCDRRLTPRIANSDWTSTCSRTLVRQPSGSASSANWPSSPPAPGV